MTASLDRVLVSPVAESGFYWIQHHEFPEIRTRAESPEAAARCLISQLERALDTALTIWRRELLEDAIADVREFAAQP